MGNNLVTICCDDDEEDLGARRYNNNVPIAANLTAVSDDQLDLLKLNSDLTQTLMLQISCKGLENADRKSKSDPFALIWLLDDKSGQKTRIGMTECIQDTLNPDFVTQIKVDFHFEEQQKFQIDIYDADNMMELEDTRRHDLQGYAQFSLHEVVTCKQ